MYLIYIHAGAYCSNISENVRKFPYQAVIDLIFPLALSCQSQLSSARVNGCNKVLLMRPDRLDFQLWDLRVIFFNPITPSDAYKHTYVSPARNPPADSSNKH